MGKGSSVKTDVIKPAKREEYIDVIAGIMISWMLLGHCRLFSNFGVFTFFKYLSFYMPWFFYKSGMFFTPKNRVALIKKDAKKLLRPFVIYSAIGWVVWCICGLVDGSLGLKSCIILPVKDFFHHGSVYGNAALWFLLSLFIVRQLSNLLIGKQLHPPPPPMLTLICFIIAAALYMIGWYNHSWWFGNVFSGMCFFLLGYWLKDKEDKWWLFVLSILVYGLVLFSYCLGWTDDFPRLHMHSNTMKCGNYLLFYPMALAGIIIINNIFRIACRKIRFRILEYIGKNSMIIYTIHWILFIVVTFVAKYFFHCENPTILFIVLLGSCILFLPLVIEIMKLLKIKNKD